MKLTQFSILSLVALLLFTCKSSKQTTSSSTASTPAATTTPAPSAGIVIKSADGIYAPGEAELNAYKPFNKDITLEKLNKGYSLYAQSACIQCHQAKNIYDIKASDWNGILEDMAQKARITNEQKNAVYDYVLAIKTTKLKQGN